MFHRVKPEAEQENSRNQVRPQSRQPELRHHEVPSNPEVVSYESPDKLESKITTSVPTLNNQSTDKKEEALTMTDFAEAKKVDTQTQNEVASSYASPYQRQSQAAPAQQVSAQPAPAQNVQGGMQNLYTSSYGTGAYAGQSSAAAYAPKAVSAPQAPAQRESSEPAMVGDRTLTIGRGITMSGEIESCDYLLVEGTVEAALKGASVLEISETGTFYGTVEIDEATVAGRFEGDITVNGRLTIKAGGVVTGSISYRELEVEAGAIIDGRITPVVNANASSSSRPATVKPAAKVAKAAVKEAAPANSDGELFAAARAGSAS